LLRTQKTYADAVEQLSISPNGRWLVSGSARWTSASPDHVAVQVWQLPDAAVLQTLKGCGPDFVMAPAAWPDLGQQPGGVLTCASADGTPRVWQLPVAKAIKRLRGHEGEVARLAISPTPLDEATGQLLLVTGSDDRTLRLWSLPDGKSLRTLIGHTGAIWCLAISPDGRLLASGSHDHTVRTWSLPDGEPTGTLKGHTHGVTHLAFSPAPPDAAGGSPPSLPGGTTQLLVSASTDNSIRLWGLPDGTALKTMEGRGPIAISPDGTLLVSAHSGGGVWLWQLPDGLPLKRLDMRTVANDGLFGGGQQATCLAFGSNLPPGRTGGQWLVAGSGDGRIWAWASDLADLCERPLVQSRLEDIQWAQEAHQAKAVTEAERRWLELVLGMMRWRRRFDILLEEAPRRIAVGEFDIEIEE
jgi:WD40 repeat protein